MEILNIILERKDDPIMSIVLKNPINTAAREDEKETIMDIRAETSSGEELDIEMQSGNLRVYPDRVLFYGGRLEFHFLELGKVDGQKPVEELTETERLAAYLKYANVEEKQDYVQEIVDSEGITMTENAYRKVTQDEIEHERMESRLKYQLQYNTDMSLARQEGMELGFEQGRTEGEAAGRQEMKLELARAMKAKGMETEVIAEITGLPAAEIEKL